MTYDGRARLTLGYGSPTTSPYLVQSPYLGTPRSRPMPASPAWLPGMATTVSTSPPDEHKLVEVDDDRVDSPRSSERFRPPVPPPAPPVPAPPKHAVVEKPPPPPAPPTDFTIKDLGIKEVDLVVGGKDPTSGAIVAFPVRRMNLISSSTVLAEKLKTKPAPFGAGPDEIKNLPFIQLDENASLMERVLPFLYNELDLPKTTDIHFFRAIFQAADKYKMRRLFDWMTEKLKAGWPSATPEVAINLHAVVKKAGDDEFAATILDGMLEKYNWTFNREGENKWTCDSGTGPRALKDMTDAIGLDILLAIANRRQCRACKKLPFKEEKKEEVKEDKKD